MTKVYYLLALLCAVTCSTASTLPRCSLPVDLDSLKFPVLWDEQGIVVPNEKIGEHWTINVPYGKKINVSCPDQHEGLMTVHNYLSYPTRVWNNKVTEITCVEGDVVEVVGSLEKFEKLYCAIDNIPDLVEEGSCHDENVNVNVRFDYSSVPYNIYSVCYNKDKYDTLFTHHQIQGPDLGEQEPIGNRPGFKEAGFYPSIDAQNCYKGSEQKETVAALLNSWELANRYVQPGSQYFMSRGHLVPSGDPIYQYQKKSTYYFINVTPQWQIMNGGNWLRMEETLRSMAGGHQAVLDVWTGLTDVMTLEDEQGRLVEIYLAKDYEQYYEKLPGHQINWKVIVDKTRGQGVAIVMFNNPYIKYVRNEDLLCSDVCDQINWISWNTKDLEKGYTYCCDVKSFHEAVPYAPDLGDLELLNY